MERAVAVVKDISGQPKGVLRVTASVSFGLKCIVPLLPQFAAKYLDLTVDLLLTDAVVDLFAERIDVAVRLGKLASFEFNCPAVNPNSLHGLCQSQIFTAMPTTKKSQTTRTTQLLAFSPSWF
jgi:DNA-binding transcriptional LysR family regulator